jgi:predicted ATP-grasp superfamily ATP-dependent carboligase
VNSSKRLRRVALLASGPPISLKVLYCLHAMGVKTDVLDLGDNVSMARYSRYRRRYKKLEPGATNGNFDAEETARALAVYLKDNDIDGVVGGDILATASINAMRPWLGGALIFPSSDFKTLQMLDDKWEFQQFMVENGIPCPRSILIKRNEDLAMVEASLGFPVIAKPLRGESSHGVVRIENIDTLRRHLRADSKYTRLPLLVQEFCPGQDADISFLAHEGRIQCHTLHTRTGGCTLEFIRNDAVYEVAVRIAKAAHYTGVANIDVRIDPATNAVKVLECNPRFWYTLQASLWRGLNFVEAGFSVARGDHIECAALDGGVYHLHGCLLKKLIWNPRKWKKIEGYNIKGLFQAISDPLPFIAGRP